METLIKYKQMGETMKRRDFLGKTSCGLAGLAVSPILFDNTINAQPSANAKYKLEVEIYEGKETLRCHQKGQKYTLPKDMGKICPWLLSSMHDVLILLQRGVTLPWLYKDTPYEKVIDPDGVTTEFIRCPDPTADLVVKIIRTKIA